MASQPRIRLGPLSQDGVTRLGRQPAEPADGLRRSAADLYSVLTNDRRFRQAHLRGRRTKGRSRVQATDHDHGLRLPPSPDGRPQLLFVRRSRDGRYAAFHSRFLLIAQIFQLLLIACFAYSTNRLTFRLGVKYRSFSTPRSPATACVPSSARRSLKIRIGRRQWTLLLRSIIRHSPHRWCCLASPPLLGFCALQILCGASVCFELSLLACRPVCLACAQLLKSFRLTF